MKGEGTLLMVADFVSTDYGWLQSPDGAVEAWVYFKAKKAYDGYFTNSNILEHATKAMNILEDHFLHNKHIFIFDNAMTYLKHPNDGLSA